MNTFLSYDFDFRIFKGTCTFPHCASHHLLSSSKLFICVHGGVPWRGRRILMRITEQGCALQEVVVSNWDLLG